MISKSKSRADKSFKQLYEYLSRDEESVIDSYNLYANPYNQEEVIEEFLKNADYLNKARGKNYFYHEIISLPENTLSLQKQQEILKDISGKYLLLRAENHLAITVTHLEKEHKHIHLMISANEIMGEKRVRLSKKEFAQMQKEIETYKNSIHKELKQSKHYQQEPSKKELLRTLLRELFSKANSKQELEKLAQAMGLEFATRGKTIRVIFKDNPYRLRTLGVLKAYKECIQEPNQHKQEKEQKQEKGQTKTKQKEKDSKRKMWEDLQKQKEVKNEKKHYEQTKNLQK